MDVIKNGYEQLVNAIIRPPRCEYELSDLGPALFTLRGKRAKRTDFELVNSRGLTLQCSYYEPTKRPAKLPCVIYCHGNCGSRLDATEALRLLIPMNVCVLSFDFSGSGLSQGEFVSLGYYEKLDLEAVVDWLRKSIKVTRIGLWGRSMGAVTSILFGVSDPSIACMVLDSPFSSLNTLSSELVEKLQSKIPKLMVKVGMKLITKSVRKQANFDIAKLEPIKEVDKCFIPCLFAHGEEDDFIHPSHSKKLHEKYSGDKNLILFKGDHNSMRPGFFYDSAAIFFSNHLLVESDFGGDNPLTKDEVEDEDLDELPIDIINQLSLSEENSMSQVLYYAPTSSDEEDEQLRQAILLSMQGDSSVDTTNADLTSTETKDSTVKSEQNPNKQVTVIKDNTEKSEQNSENKSNKEKKDK